MTSYLAKKLKILDFNFLDDLLFIYETSAQTMLKVLSKYHVPPKGIRHDDAQFLTNMVIQFANQFVCQVDLNLKLATRRIKFIGMPFYVTWWTSNYRLSEIEVPYL